MEALEEDYIRSQIELLELEKSIARTQAQKESIQQQIDVLKYQATIDLNTYSELDSIEI